MTTPITPMRYRPDAKGLERWLGSLEAAVMAEVWARRLPFTVKQVWHALAERQLAYTTIMTTVHRLYEKGLLSRDDTPHPNNAQVYRAACTQTEFIELQECAIVASLERTRERGA